MVTWSWSWHGGYGHGITNEKGEMILKFCVSNEHDIGGYNLRK